VLVVMMVLVMMVLVMMVLVMVMVVMVVMVVAPRPIASNASHRLRGWYHESCSQASSEQRHD
jgi:hypothetical protein